MMRDLFGRPLGLRPARDPWAIRRAPAPSTPRPSPSSSREIPVRTAGPPAVAVPFGALRPPLVAAPPPVAAQPPPPPPEVAPPPPVREEAGPLQADALAELEASRARLAREAVREREAERLRLVGEVLPVLDDLDRSIAAARGDRSVQPALVEGFDLVRARLERVLHGYGLERIDALGARFDPAVHDAIGLVEVDDPGDEGLVIDEVERGYRAGPRVVRPARVRVGVAG